MRKKQTSGSTSKRRGKGGRKGVYRTNGLIKTKTWSAPWREE